MILICDVFFFHEINKVNKFIIKYSIAPHSLKLKQLDKLTIYTHFIHLSNRLISTNEIYLKMFILELAKFPGD